MKTKYLALAAFAAIVASCSNDEDFVPQDDRKDTPITVTVGVAELTTRAGYEGTSELPETFYLSMTQDEEKTASKYNYTNAVMTKGTGNAYTSTTTLLWMSSDHDVPAINAYTTAAGTFSVKTNQSTTEAVLASDLLGAIKTDDNTDFKISDDNIAIGFRHLLCKLDVTFTWGTELATATSKTIKSVKYVDFGTKVTLDRGTCTVTGGTTTADIQAYVNGTTSEAIFAPHVGSAPEIVILATIDGADRMFSIDVKAPTDGFASGNRYTMNVTIGGTAVDGGSVTATMTNGWGETIPGNMATN